MERERSSKGSSQEGQVFMLWKYLSKDPSFSVFIPKFQTFHMTKYCILGHKEQPTNPRGYKYSILKIKNDNCWRPAPVKLKKFPIVNLKYTFFEKKEKKNGIVLHFFITMVIWRCPCLGLGFGTMKDWRQGTRKIVQTSFHYFILFWWDLHA